MEIEYLIGIRILVFGVRYPFFNKLISSQLAKAES